MHSLSAYTSSHLCACDCSDASFGYPGGPLLFKNLNFGIDLDSRIASKDGTSYFLSICDYCIKVGLVTIMKFYCSIKQKRKRIVFLCHLNLQLGSILIALLTDAAADRLHILIWGFDIFMTLNLFQLMKITKRPENVTKVA